MGPLPDKRLRARATKHPKMPVAGRGPATGSEDLIGVGSSSLRDLPLPADRSVRRSVGFKALLRVRVRCAPLRCRRRTPYPPWAFSPPRFPTDRRRSPEGDEQRPWTRPRRDPSPAPTRQGFRPPTAPTRRPSDRAPKCGGIPPPFATEIARRSLCGTEVGATTAPLEPEGLREVVGIADLPGVSDVKERSEERLLGRVRCAPLRCRRRTP